MWLIEVPELELQPVSSLRSKLEHDPAPDADPLAYEEAVLMSAVQEGVTDILGRIGNGVEGTVALSVSGGDTGFQIDVTITDRSEPPPPTLGEGTHITIAAGLTILDAAGNVLATGPGGFDLTGVENASVVDHTGETVAADVSGPPAPEPEPTPEPAEPEAPVEPPPAPDPPAEPVEPPAVEPPADPAPEAPAEPEVPAEPAPEAPAPDPAETPGDPETAVEGTVPPEETGDGTV